MEAALPSLWSMKSGQRQAWDQPSPKFICGETSEGPSHPGRLMSQENRRVKFMEPLEVIKRVPITMQSHLQIGGYRGNQSILIPSQRLHPKE